jgi:hypothetical protein
MSVGKYLKHYAENEIELVQDLENQWQDVVCIPAYDEAETLPLLLKNLSQQSNLLLILVLNSPESASGSESLLRTKELGSLFKQQFSLQQNLSENCQLRQLNNIGSHLLLLEHYSIPDKQGVGLARKIACDIACQLIHDKKVLSPWIHNTDADVDLPSEYLSISLQLNNGTAAALFSFRHENNPQEKLQLCLQLYDYSLHYYVEALLWSASPYAFHTIGSTLLLHHHYYALARGFPKRSAGEDFYLLNKLKKIGDIQRLSAPVITLSGRTSSRAPFGTGPAINKISDFKNPVDEYLFYHPHCFLLLKNWLTLMPTLWAEMDLQSLIDDELLLNCLIQIGVEEALSHARQHSKNQDSFVKHMHNWFDAFRTLKLIHSLRDKGLGSINKMQLNDYKNDFPFIASAEKAQK